jgi:hypothetical protein
MEDRMANKKKANGFRSAIREGFALWVLCVMAISAAHAQGEKTQAYRRVEERFQIGSVADAVKKVKQGKFLGVHVEEIAEAGAVEAIPALQEQFARSLEPNASAEIDPGNKGVIASALVRLGDKGQVYWDFLENPARTAVESGPPFPIRFDAQGKIMPYQLTPELLEWAKSRSISPEDAAQIAMYDMPGKVLLLAETGDPRGLPLLRQAMSSPNYMIQAEAAKGLAKLQDKESIPMIIGACQRAPVDMAAVIAQALIFFDDPQAQSAAEKYIPNDMLKALREVRHEPVTDPFQ